MARDGRSPVKIPVKTRASDPESTSVRFLRVSDRCDQCGAEAFVVVIVLGADLYFCGHHFGRNEVKLREVAQAVFDDRAWINRQHPA
jgi:hypothetical protein